MRAGKVTLKKNFNVNFYVFFTQFLLDLGCNSRYKKGNLREVRSGGHAAREVLYSPKLKEEAHGRGAQGRRDPRAGRGDREGRSGSHRLCVLLGSIQPLPVLKIFDVL